ncbi:hydroxypyruvate isomerase family protein [Paracoccus sp. (in: a-proteobacteria)]|uniref:hydroxypyruvate isomerase family protein n=1 Tax=Paracoccus sp. TaxID=267 RepID=UPI002AFF2321|nr:TIM barrel protein [Paracoccus sp. (in: a-proteobacteria)]
MARFAANLTYLFTEMPMLQRFAAARRAGFKGVEILFPYDLAVKELASAAQAAGIEFVLMNTPPPNWAGGPRGFAAEPGNETRFRGDFDRALRFAKALKVQHIHVMAGKGEGEPARRTFVENLKWACARDPQTSLTIEPMARADMPGYFLDSFDLAAEVLDKVRAPNLGLQFDVYQAQMIHGDALAVWQRHAGRVRHIQISDCPDRNEPRQGTIDFPELLRAIDASGYGGWVGAEYSPRTSTEAGLHWLQMV